MLIFYGLALLNASKYTKGEIRAMGLLQLLLGLAAAFWTEGSLLLWMMGFGILNAVYGFVMYLKYER